MCLLCATFALSIFALGMVLVSGTQDVVTDLEITYSKNGNAITFVISNDCNNQEDFAQIEVNKNTKTAVVEQPANPDVLGKCFAGWYTDENLINKIESFPVTLSAGTQLYPSYYDAVGAFTYEWDDQANGYNVYLDSDTYYYYEYVYYEDVGEVVECYTNVEPGLCYLPDIYDDGIHGVGPVVSFDPTYIELDGITDFYNSYSVTIPIDDCIISNHIQSVSFYGAYDTSALGIVTLGNSVTSIGDYAFYSCTGLTSVTIGNSVTSIGDSAFFGCSGLTSVTIGNGVTSIGNDAFCGCFGITSIVIPNSTTSIGNSAFEDCSSLASITIGNGVTSIGAQAFLGCSSLTSVTIPNSVTVIGSDAFASSGLTSITIPHSVTSIGDDAFSGCSLTSISIGSGVTSIGYRAFYGCSNTITSITVDSNNTNFFVENNGLIEISTGTLLLGYKDTTISNNVVIIALGAFYGCRGLTSITIPSSVTTINAYAFCNTALTSAIFEVTSGWFYQYDVNASYSLDISSDYANNAELIKRTYYNKKIYR